MSFRQGARQFFERRGTPPPPLPYDAEVEYLESTGTQYINLSQAIAGRTIATEIRWVPVSSVNDRFVHGGGQNSSPQVRIGTYSNQNPFVAVDGTTCYIYIPNGAIVSKVDRQYVVCRTNLYHSDYIYLYCQEWSRLPNGLISARIFDVKISDSGGNAIMNLVPVRFTNEQNQSEGAMYDRVSGALFRNAGTGAFTIGPDK